MQVYIMVDQLSMKTIQTYWHNVLEKIQYVLQIQMVFALPYR